LNGQILLADFAQTSEGKVSALGLGWTITGTPTPPMAVILLIDIPWDKTNKKHKVTLALLDADGHPVVVGQDANTGKPQHIQFNADVEAGRPAGIPEGTEQRTSTAIAIGPGIPLTAGQAYEWRLEIDGEHKELWSARFLVRP